MPVAQQNGPLMTTADTLTPADTKPRMSLDQMLDQMNSLRAVLESITDDAVMDAVSALLLARRSQIIHGHDIDCDRRWVHAVRYLADVAGWRRVPHV